MRGRPNKEEKYHNYISQLEAKEKRESFRQIFFLCIIATAGLGVFLLFQMVGISSNSDSLVEQDYYLKPETQSGLNKTETAFDTEDLVTGNFEENQAKEFVGSISQEFIAENQPLRNKNIVKKRGRKLVVDEENTRKKDASNNITGNDQIIEESSNIPEGNENSVPDNYDRAKLEEDASDLNLEKAERENKNEERDPVAAPNPNSVEKQSQSTASIKSSNDIKNNPVKPTPKVTKRLAPKPVAEKMPQFPGGVTAMNKFLSKRINYPMAAKDHKVQGKVYLQFVVEPDGSLTEMKVARGLGYGCDEEALRVARKMPKWIPGEDKGQKIPVIYTLAVQFRIQ